MKEITLATKPANPRLLTINGGSTNHALPRPAQLLPIPHSNEAQGVRRYRFHEWSYAFLIKKWIGAFAAALSGPNTLVFSAGNEKNCPFICSGSCDELGFLGIELNESWNAETAEVISTGTSRAMVRVIRTDEELMIKRSVWRIERTALETKAIEGATA